VFVAALSILFTKKLVTCLPIFPAAFPFLKNLVMKPSLCYTKGFFLETDISWLITLLSIFPLILDSFAFDRCIDIGYCTNLDSLVGIMIYYNNYEQFLEKCQAKGS
jgi:hypothetical protein